MRLDRPLAAFVVRQASSTLRPEYEVDLEEVDDQIVRVRCTRAGTAECSDCVVTGDDVRGFLLEMFAKRGIAVEDVAVSMTDDPGDRAGDGVERQSDR